VQRSGCEIVARDGDQPTALKKHANLVPAPACRHRVIASRAADLRARDQALFLLREVGDEAITGTIAARLRFVFAKHWTRDLRVFATVTTLQVAPRQSTDSLRVAGCGYFGMTGTSAFNRVLLSAGT